MRPKVGARTVTIRATASANKENHVDVAVIVAVILRKIDLRVHLVKGSCPNLSCIVPLIVVIDRIVVQVNWTNNIESWAETPLTIVVVVVTHTTGALPVRVRSAVLVHKSCVISLVGHVVVEVLRIAASELEIVIIH